MDTVDRIFELADAKFREQRDFAKALGMTASIVSEWRRRKSASYQKHLPKIADALGTSVQYLLTGDRPDPIAVSALSPEDEALLRKIHDSPDMRALFSLTSKASPEDIRKAVQIMRITMGLPEELP